jgi:shikimate kinase
MHLTLIGMSGIGKSYWSQALTSLGFQRICCDDLISHKLSALTGQILVGLEGVSDWLGEPEQEGYTERNNLYLACEAEVTAEVNQQIMVSKPAAPTVIDTTGSIIYLPPQLLEPLAQNSVVVYLQASAEQYQLMLEAFLQAPRPLFWNGLYQPRPEETMTQTIRRCYPLLLQQRHLLYEKLAQITLPFDLHRRPGLTPTHFLQAITQVQNL